MPGWNAYLPGIGWAPFDPTLGRIQGWRERYFAAMPADHLILTIGRHPSTLRGSSYYSHIYWGAADSDIRCGRLSLAGRPFGKMNSKIPSDQKGFLILGVYSLMLQDLRQE